MSCRYTLTIDDAPALQALAEAERHAPKETGGVLLGHHDPRTGVSVVSELVGAGPGAQRENHRFDPDAPWQRARIAERYEASGRTLAYLGDWHSHPLGGGPSDLDRSTARRIAHTPAARCPHPIMLIAAYTGEGWELRAYRLAVRRLASIEVEVRRPMFHKR